MDVTPGDRKASQRPPKGPVVPSLRSLTLDLASGRIEGSDVAHLSIYRKPKLLIIAEGWIVEKRLFKTAK
jgi:hypothetical protein